MTIDALFGPLPPRVSQGRVYIWDPIAKKLKSVRLRLGVTDGQYTELLEGEIPRERGTGDGGHARQRIGEPEPVAVVQPADAAAARRHDGRPPAAAAAAAAAGRREA